MSNLFDLMLNKELPLSGDLYSHAIDQRALELRELAAQNAAKNAEAKLLEKRKRGATAEDANADDKTSKKIKVEYGANEVAEELYQILAFELATSSYFSRLVDARNISFLKLSEVDEKLRQHIKEAAERWFTVLKDEEMYKIGNVQEVLIATFRVEANYLDLLQKAEDLIDKKIVKGGGFSPAIETESSAQFRNEIFSALREGIETLNLRKLKLEHEIAEIETQIAKEDLPAKKNKLNKNIQERKFEIRLIEEIIGDKNAKPGELNFNGMVKVFEYLEQDLSKKTVQQINSSYLDFHTQVMWKINTFESSQRAFMSGQSEELRRSSSFSDFFSKFKNWMSDTLKKVISYGELSAKGTIQSVMKHEMGMFKTKSKRFEAMEKKREKSHQLKK